MTDTGAAETQTPEAAPAIRVLAQFVRDFSFENPRAPDSLRLTSQPSIELGVELSARGRPDGLFELDLKMSATAKTDTDTQFQAELVYGGLFEIQGVPEEQIEPMLMVECPRFLFPFARRIIADATVEGGFPPLMLEPIDFGALYMAQLQQREQGVAPPSALN